MKDVCAVWGCGRGPAKSLQPHIRILMGLLCGSACLILPLPSISGASLMAVITVCWCACVAMPVKILVRCAIASAVLFLPFLLLTPWMSIDSAAAVPLYGRISQAGAIALRSTCCFFITASTIATLAMHDFHRGLARLPLPSSVVMLIVQLVNQTMSLAEETLRIIGVLRLRGASGVKGTRVLFSFPIVWMLRMLFRAERTAAAMTVRGYGVEILAKEEKNSLSLRDAVALFATCAVVMASLFLRLRTL